MRSRRFRSPWLLPALCAAALIVTIALTRLAPSPHDRFEASARRAVEAELHRIGARAADPRAYRTPGGNRVDLAVEVDGARVLGQRLRLREEAPGLWRSEAIGETPGGRPLPPLAFDPILVSAAFADTSAGLRGAAAGERAWFRSQGRWVGGVVVGLPLRRYAGEALPWIGPPPAAGDPADLELRFDADGNLLEARDLLIRAPRSGRGLIFDPNPVVRSGRRELRDGMPVDQYRDEVAIERLDGTGRLHGARVRVDSGDRLTAREEEALFFYSSRDPRFEEVMAYAHIDRTLEWLDSLGFGDLLTRAQRVTVHASPADNSWYSPLTKRIEFGDGGVDDAEDADIILHELGHAVHDAFVPGFGEGDARAISEGFADYLAATRSGDPCIGDWDATSYSPPCLRRTDLFLRYPSDLRGSSHLDGRIWSGALWELRERLGPRIVDPLVLEGLLLQRPDATFPSAARALVEAAGLLGLDADLPAIREVLADRGLLDRSGRVDLRESESARVALDRPWPGAPGADGVLFRGDGSVAVGDSLLLVPWRPAQPEWIEIDYAAGADGFAWEWKIGAGGRNARGSVRLAADGACDLAWREADAPSHAGEIGILTAEIPPVRVAAADLFEGSILPPSFLAARPAADAAAASRIRLVREPLGWRPTVQLSPRAPGGLGLLPLGNPSRGPASIRIDLPEGGQVSLDLFDPAGRRIRTILDRTVLPPGPHQIDWGGDDARGGDLGPGIYFLQLRAGGRIRSATLVRLPG